MGVCQRAERIGSGDGQRWQRVTGGQDGRKTIDGSSCVLVSSWCRAPRSGCSRIAKIGVGRRPVHGDGRRELFAAQSKIDCKGRNGGQRAAWADLQGLSDERRSKMMVTWWPLDLCLAGEAGGNAKRGRANVECRSLGGSMEAANFKRKLCSASAVELRCVTGPAM